MRRSSLRCTRCGKNRLMTSVQALHAYVKIKWVDEHGGTHTVTRKQICAGCIDIVLRSLLRGGNDGR